MKNRYFLLLIILFSSLSIKNFAQVVERDERNESTTFVNKYIKNLYTAPPAPEAASLGKYGHTPMSLYTGVANISVPIHTIKGKTISVPISLSYSTQGYKTDEIAPWVGLGWTLNAGGVITRTVKGGPDMNDNYYSQGSVTLLESTPPTIGLMGNAFEYYNLMQDIMSGKIDSQPDMFVYNTPTGSGKFYIAPSGKIYKHEYNDLKIEVSPSMTDFTITDEKGVVYKFTENEYTKVVLDDEYDVVLPPAYINMNYTSSWYLSEIISPNGTEKIKFTYQKVLNVLQSNGAVGTNGLTVSWKQPDTTPTPTYNYSEANTNENNTYTDRLFLNKIEYFSCENGCTTTLGNALEEVTFNSINGRKDFAGIKALDNIVVSSYRKNRAGITGLEVNKKFELNYGYFNYSNALSPRNNLTIPVTNDKSIRLKLVSVQEFGKNEDTQGSSAYKSLPPYKFEYNLETLPNLFSTSTDHWGYFNANNSTYLAPTPTEPSVAALFSGYNLADRESNENAMKAGVLTKIIYPTGGYTTYEYEANKIKKQEDNSLYIVGGLRISKMTDFSETGTKASIRIYEYVLSDNTSSGKLFTMPEYTFFTSKKIYGATLQNPSSCLPIYTQYSITLSSSSRYTMATAKGTHFGYSRVVEKMIDGLGKTNGYKVYNYTNDLSENPQQEDIENGDLISEEIFDVNSIKQRETIYNYAYTPHSEGFSSNLKAFRVGAIPNDDNRLYMCEAGIVQNIVRFNFNRNGDILESLPDEAINSPVIRTLTYSELGNSMPEIKDYIKNRLQILTNNAENILNTNTTFRIYVVYGAGNWVGGCGNLIPVISAVFPFALTCKDRWYYEIVSTIPGSRSNFRWNYSPTETCPGDAACNPGTQRLLKGKFTINQSWSIRSRWRYLVSKEEKVYESNSSGLSASIKTEYFYDKKHTLPNKELVYESDGSTSSIVKKYVGDFDTSIATDVMSLTLKKMKDEQNMIAVEVSSTKLTDLNRVGASINYFKTVNSNVQPDKVDVLEILTPESFIGTNFDYSKDYPKIQSGSFFANKLNSPNSYTTRVLVKDFDNYGNATEIKKQDDLSRTCYVYGYKGRFVIAEVKINSSDADKCNLINNNVNIVGINSNFYTDDELNAKCEALRLSLLTGSAHAFVTYYTYHPIFGITSSTDPSGRRTYYIYDELGRLQKIENHQKQVIKSYQYKYQSE